MPDEGNREVAEAIASLATTTGRVHTLVILGDPKAKARARIWKRPNGKMGSYTPSHNFQKALSDELTLRLGSHGPFLSGVSVFAVFFRPNLHRIDADNMLKLVLDAGTKAGLWHDDSQVTSVGAVVEWDQENPRTVIRFAEHQSTMLRGDRVMRPCEKCRSMFKPPHSTSKVRFCSMDCKSALVKESKCAECGSMFRRTTSSNMLCSPECRVTRLRGRIKPVTREVSKCVSCGKTLSKPGYQRCRKCWKDFGSKLDLNGVRRERGLFGWSP